METLIAYYCFTNHGWAPSKFYNLPYGERTLVTAFALRELNARKKENQKAGVK